MLYKEFVPSTNLQAFIKCFWILENSAGVSRPETIMPDGCPEIVFNLAEPIERHHPDHIELQPSSIIVGQLKRSVSIQPTADVKLFGIRFTPAGIYPLIRQPVGELTDRIESIDSVLGAIGRELEIRIEEAAGVRERISIVESTLSQLFSGFEQTSLAMAAVGIIIATKGRVRIRRLAGKLGVNQKTIERRFNTEIGITPKLFCRIIRLQNVLQMARDRDFAGWADLACMLGYADQAHLIKDFRGFAGVPPKHFSGGENSISDLFVG